MHNFQKLECYQRSKTLAAEIISQTEDLRPYKVLEQITDSSFSIPSNIAEGAYRNTDKDFVRFLYYSLSSAAELQTQLEILYTAGKLPKDWVSHWEGEIKEIIPMIINLIRVVEKEGNY